MAQTLLCVPILVQDEPTALADARAAYDLEVDLVEFRLDELFTGALDAHGQLDATEVNAVLRLVASSPLPCIVTCRTAAEGGHYEGSEDARLALYERLAAAGKHAALGAARIGGVSDEHPPRYLDVELQTYTRTPGARTKIDHAIDHPSGMRDVRTGLILSLHDFKQRPADLMRKLGEMSLEPAASVIKVAYHARSIRDNLELFDLLKENAAGRPMIALGMGEFGLMSRVLAPKFGGFLTFASIRRTSTTAPGQPTARDLLETYRFRSICSATRVFGVVGYPLEHSLSPLVHNTGFESLAPDTWDSSEIARCLNGVYLPLPVPEGYEHFKASLSALIDHPHLDFGGCSVTLPHKQNLVRLARERIATGDGQCAWSIDELSEACGAANTLSIVRNDSGAAVEARVTNTDAPAAIACLKASLNRDINGATVALLGAGGASRSLAAGLLLAGARVLIVNRSTDNAKLLIDELADSPLLRDRASMIEIADAEALRGRSPDAIINATPVGMAGGPAPKSSPLDAAHLDGLSPATVVMDTVYRPLDTPLLLAARERKLKTVDGLCMFARQAATQFETWTGVPGPLGLFERVSREALTLV